MPKIEDTFDWCLKHGEKGEKHKGLRKIEPSIKKSKRHIDKAHHNLRAFDHNKEKFSDWSVSMAFYAMYHSLLAILFKVGYESRNQECTITAIEYLIDKEQIEFDRKYIDMIRRTSEMIPTDAKEMREEFQYGTDVSADTEVLDALRKNTVEFIEAVRICLEKI